MDDSVLDFESLGTVLPMVQVGGPSTGRNQTCCLWPKGKPDSALFLRALTLASGRPWES